MRAHVVLEDGFHLVGEAFVGEGQVSGEVVFNTAHTGYQEVLTDPSYTGQAVVFTYPLIGSIGVNPEDAESSRIAPAALIVREYVPRPSNWRATMSLADWLKETGVIGVHQIDTRALVRHLRQAGSLKGIIATIDGDLDDAAREELARKAAASPGVVGQDLVRLVGTKKAYEYVPGRGVVPAGSGRSAQAHARAKLEAMAQAHAGTQAHAETEARAGTGAQAETQAHAETQAEAHALTPGHKPSLKARLARSFAEDGIAIAMRYDVDPLRHAMRGFHMLEHPQLWRKKPWNLVRVLSYWARGKRRNAQAYPPKAGPERIEMMQALGLDHQADIALAAQQKAAA